MGGPPPPKGDPVFELKKLTDTLKYAYYLDEKKIYHVIINANLSEHEEKRLLKTLRKHRAAISYTLEILRALVPLYVSTRLIWSLMISPSLIINAI